MEKLPGRINLPEKCIDCYSSDSFLMIVMKEDIEQEDSYGEARIGVGESSPFSRGVCWSQLLRVVDSSGNNRNTSPLAKKYDIARLK